MVITDPQVMLNILTHLTAVLYKLKNKESLETVPCDVDFKSFTKNAIITFHFFKELRTGPEQERKILTDEKLLQIFQDLLLAVKIHVEDGAQDRYFLPALLPTVSLEEIHELRKQQTLPPLVLLFAQRDECNTPCGCSPCGLFCASVVKLLSKQLLGWTLYKQSPTCSNCITLQCNTIPVVVRFVDSFEHFEVHAVKNCCPEFLPKVKRMIEAAIYDAIEDRNYKPYLLQTGFFCRDCDEVARLVHHGKKNHVFCSFPHCNSLKEERMWIDGMM